MDKKWNYLERNTLHRQSVGHLGRWEALKYSLLSFYGLSNFIMKACVHAQSVWLFCDPMDYRPSDSSVHGISQASVLEWAAISSSMGFSHPKNWTWVSCIAGRFFTNWAIREALETLEEVIRQMLSSPFYGWSFYAGGGLTVNLGPGTEYLTLQSCIRHYPLVLGQRVLGQTQNPHPPKAFLDAAHPK